MSVQFAWCSKYSGQGREGMPTTTSLSQLSGDDIVSNRECYIILHNSTHSFVYVCADNWSALTCVLTAASHNAVDSPIEVCIYRPGYGREIL